MFTCIMWKMFKAVNGGLTTFSLAMPVSANNTAVRGTAILRRRYPPRLHKKGCPPKPLKSKNFIYDLVKLEDTVKKPNIQVILTKYVETLGNKGDIVSVEPCYAYDKLLLPGKATYVTPENLELFQKSASENFTKQSSPYSVITVNVLSRVVLSVVMNKENEWILKPWHITTSFRKCGYIVPENAITLPSKTIKGPDDNLEGREFSVTVSINNMEKVDVRCRIHHWSTSLSNRIPYDFEFWNKPSQPIFPEQSEILNLLRTNKIHKI